MGKVGGFTSFAAEAALWIAGGMLVASAAGAHWATPNVDLAAMIAAPTPSGPHATGSPTPKPTPRPSASPTTPLAAYLAWTKSDTFQYQLTWTGTWTGRTTTLTGTTTYTGASAANANDCSDAYSWISSSGTKGSTAYVLIGSTGYDQSNGGAWKQSNRAATDTCEAVGLLTYTGLTDNGVETKAGAKLHKLVVTDAIQFASYYEKFERAATGRTATQATMTVWVNDSGMPVFLEITGSDMETVSGVQAHATFTYNYTITKVSGVTIAAPTK